MDKLRATELIKRTFEQPFEKEQFDKFIRELLNGYKPDPFIHKGNVIQHSFSEHVSTFERLGKYTDADDKRLDILIVHLKKDHSVGHARTMQRNFIAGYLKGAYGRSSSKDAALVAFVSPNSADWRFSLVKMDTVFDKSSGRPKPVDEFTPARRWSFLVGVNEGSHTAQSRLVPILVEDENSPTLGELEEAFNIESVTKEFFTKYRDLFLATKEALDKTVKNDPAIEKDFEGKGVNTVDFAKKLLGQIVFLYFLQKKGWFGVPKNGTWGSGSKQFLRELFEKKHGSYTNFFNDVLESLFYEALRRDRGDEDHYYSQFNCKIPFLNGGLFDPIFNYDWSNTDILLPDDLFSNRRKTKDGDIGDGILDVFDRYNFTVKEDEPLEKEVAIDPELLGKAYEKFNAIRPDNFSEYKKALKTGDEGKFNKKFGVYYTPREIVHYMCQQSLINYLYTGLNSEQGSCEKIGEKNLDLLGNVAKKGQLEIIAKHKTNPDIQKVDIETLVLQGDSIKEHEDHINEKGGESRTYPHKMPQSIRDNAQRIVALLSDIKVCDPAVGSGAFPVGMMSEIVKLRCILDKKKKQTAYEYKRQCIESSLYGVDIDSGAVEIAKLRLWLSLVVDEEDIEYIKPLPNLDYKVVCGDTVLGYPKYFKHSGLDNVEKQKLLFIKTTLPSDKRKLKDDIDNAILKIYSNSKTTLGYSVDFDFKINFSEIFHTDGKKGGFDIIIGNPPYGAKFNKSIIPNLKELYPIAVKGKVESYRIFIERALQICKSKGSVTFIVPNTWMFLEQAKEFRKHILENTTLNLIVSMPQSTFEAAVDSIAFLLLVDVPSKSNEVSIFEIPLKESLQNIGYYLNEAKEYMQNKWLSTDNYAITYGQDNVSNKIITNITTANNTIGNYIYIRQGLIPYLTKKEGKENKYISGKRIDGSWRPYLDGSRCVDRYYIKGKISYIKYGDWLYAPRDKEIFKGPRIIYQLIRNISLKRRIIATYLEDELYSDRNTGLIFMKSKVNLNYKYILGILNSNLLNYIHSKMHVSTYISIPSIEALPFIIADAKTQKYIISCVDKLLLLNSNEIEVKTIKINEIKNHENKINATVYKLYGLTYDDVKTVDPDFALTEKEYNSFNM